MAIDILRKNPSLGLSAEELLTRFNRNISKNAYLLDFIGRSNLFEIIGKARNEGVHSHFISELLAGSFFNGDSRESTLHHFLDLLLYRAGKEKKAGEFNDNLKKAILSRSVLFERDECVCELPIKEYHKKYGGLNDKGIESNDRIDVYLRYKLQNKIDHRDTLEIFIENKVYSSEFDAQTTRYHEACDNSGKGVHPFQLFVFLTPHPVRDMENYNQLDSKQKPDCPSYIHICYQDLLDYVIEPLSADYGLDVEKKARINEYISCMELPAMPDEDSKITSRELSIMAISSKLRKLVSAFMEDDINRRQIVKAIEIKLSEPQYVVTAGGKLLNSQEALRRSLQLIVSIIKKPLEILRRVSDCGVIGLQHGADPFLIYSPKTWRDKDDNHCKYLPYSTLYVYKGNVYSSIHNALVAAIKGYKDAHGKSEEDLVRDFGRVYATKGGGTALVSLQKEKDNKDTEMVGVFVRKKVTEDRLPDINDILGEDHAVQPIDNGSYMSLMQCNTQVYLDVPVTENILPKEIDDLLKSVSGYEQVGTTDFFFRKDVSGDKILKLNAMNVFNDGEDLICKDEDTSLLLDFFKSRMNLILSIFKIQLEAETNNSLYKEKLATYRKLLRS